MTNRSVVYMSTRINTYIMLKIEKYTVNINIDVLVSLWSLCSFWINIRNIYYQLLNIFLVEVVDVLDDEYKTYTTYNVYRGSKQRVKNHEILRKLSEPKVFELLIDYYENAKVTSGSDTPKFLYTSEVNNENLFLYLKAHPETAKFLYKNYPDNHLFMKKICDNTVEGNPLYIPDVSDNLSGYFQYDDITKEYSKLKAEIPKLREDISGYHEERTTLDNEISEISRTLDTKKKELEDIQKQLINIHETTGLDRIMNFIQTIQDTTKIVLFRGQGEVYSGDNSLTLNIDKVRKIEEISRSAIELEMYLKTEDFLSQVKLEEEKQKLFDEMKSVRTGLEAWMSRNPVRQLDRIDNKLDELCNYADQSKNEKFVRGHGMIIGKTNEVREIISEIRTEIAMEKQVKK